MYAGICDFSNYFRPGVGKIWHVVKCSPPLVFVKKKKQNTTTNKLFLATQLAHSIAYCPRRLLRYKATKAEESREAGSMWATEPERFAIWPFTEGICLAWPGLFLLLAQTVLLASTQSFPRYSLVISSSLFSFRLIKRIKSDSAQVLSLLWSLPWLGTWVRIPPQHSGCHVLETQYLIVQWFWTSYLSTMSPRFPSVKWGRLNQPQRFWLGTIAGPSSEGGLSNREWPSWLWVTRLAITS